MSRGPAASGPDAPRDRFGETTIKDFWNTHPCGDHIVGGLDQQFARDHERFFRAYDAWRYRQEGHIPACLDEVDWRGRSVLEIGLGQGAESEQIIRRGARWSGLDLTPEAVRRARTRLHIRSLPFEDVRQGSAVAIPWPDDAFDIVFSHGVLHHIPDVRTAAREIHRVLRPGGLLVAMLYARSSLNYQVSIRLLRRTALLAAFPIRRSPVVRRSAMLHQHLANAEEAGLRRYLSLENFIHRSTDGPLNPYARVYSVREVSADFADFTVLKARRHYMHAPPLPVHGWPGARLMGWHLWVHLRARVVDARVEDARVEDEGRP